MNPTEPITKLPDWSWAPKTQQEMLINGTGVIEETDFMWKIGKVAVAGFIHTNLLSPPLMWFALAEEVTISDLVDFRRLAEFIPKGTITIVESEFMVGLRFAKLYGFVDTGKDIEQFGRTYKVMRRG